MKGGYMKESQGEIIIGLLWLICGFLCGVYWLTILFSIAGVGAIFSGCIYSYKERIQKEREAKP
jgi:hypothetical protein